MGLSQIILRQSQQGIFDNGTQGMERKLTSNTKRAPLIQIYVDLCLIHSQRDNAMFQSTI